MGTEVVIVKAFCLKYIIDKPSKFIVEESYEPFMKDVVKLKLGDVFVDVGAHVGKCSLYAARQVCNSGLVIAVEPDPINVKNLKLNVRINGFKNVKVIEKACSDYSGAGFLRKYDFSAKTELVKESTEIKVEVDMLDNIIEHLKVRKVDMIKIDVNGSEYYQHKTLSKEKRYQNVLFLP
ncbi:MAG: FkbM family methyltransferase [Candidatus Bathyarchaeia archaeon]